MNILILEDSKDTSFLIRSGIEMCSNSRDHNILITECCDYDSALAASIDIKYDWLIADIDLGARLDGIDFAQRLKFRSPETKQIIYTGYELTLELEVRLTHLDYEVFLQKPLPFDRVAQCIFGEEDLQRCKEDTGGNITMDQIETNAIQKTKVKRLEEDVCAIKTDIKKEFAEVYRTMDSKFRSFTTTLLVSVGTMTAILVAAIGFAGFIIKAASGG